jgi:hypothetical protein
MSGRARATSIQAPIYACEYISPPTWIRTTWPAAFAGIESRIKAVIDSRVLAALSRSKLCHTAARSWGDRASIVAAKQRYKVLGPSVIFPVTRSAFDRQSVAPGHDHPLGKLSEKTFDTGYPCRCNSASKPCSFACVVASENFSVAVDVVIIVATPIFKLCLAYLDSVPTLSIDGRRESAALGYQVSGIRHAYRLDKGIE